MAVFLIFTFFFNTKPIWWNVLTLDNCRVNHLLCRTWLFMRELRIFHPLYVAQQNNFDKCVSISTHKCNIPPCPSQWGDIVFCV